MICSNLWNDELYINTLYFLEYIINNQQSLNSMPNKSKTKRSVT